MLPLALPALAHSPHDVVQFVSVAPDGTILANEWSSLVISHDGGHTVRYIAPPFGPPTCAIAVDATRWTLGDEAGELWHTDDAGATWIPVEGPTDVTRCLSLPGYALVGTTDSVWESTDGTAWTRIASNAPAPVVDLARAADGRSYAALADGAVYDIGDWSVRDPGPAVAVAASATGVLIAPAIGPLHRLDENTPLASPEGVLRLAAGEGGWVACTATEAAWISRDDGATWALEANGFDPLATGATGTAPEGINFLDVAATDGADVPTWAVASWQGLYLRDPDAERWQQAPLRTIPFVEAARWLADGRLLLGSYGGGIYLGTPYGTDWADISAGIDWPWSRELWVRPAADGSALGDVYMGGGNALYISHDGGATWAAGRIGMPVGGDGVALHPDYPDTPRVLFAGIDDDGRAAVARSEDAGETWTPAALPGTCINKPDALALTATYAWAACGDELSRSADGGATWALYATLPAPATAGLIALGETVYLGTESGLYRMDPDGMPTLDAGEGEMVDAFEVTADGTRYVALAGQGVFRVAPGMAAERLGWPPSEPVRAITVDPSGRILLGAFTGAWLSEDGGATWGLASGYDRVDDRDLTWVRAEPDDSGVGGWEDVDMQDAKARGAHLGGVGASATWEVEGEELVIIGAGERATVHIDVDEAGPVDIVIDRLTSPEVVWRREVAPGRHLVHLRVDAGTFRLDGGERWRTPGPGGEVGGFGDPEPEEKVDAQGCGCAVGAAHGLGGGPTGGTRGLAVLVFYGMAALVKRRT